MLPRLILKITKVFIIYKNLLTSRFRLSLDSKNAAVNGDGPPNSTLSEMCGLLKLYLMKLSLKSVPHKNDYGLILYCTNNVRS